MPTRRSPRFAHGAPLVTDRPVRILAVALAELEKAAEWYEARDPHLYDQFLDRYEQRLALALRVPGAGALAGVTASGIEIRRYRRRERTALVRSVAGDRSLRTFDDCAAECTAAAFKQALALLLASHSAPGDPLRYDLKTRPARLSLGCWR